MGGTHVALMAAALAFGTTVIENAAREPEVVDLAECLNKMGAKIRGAGTPRIEIEGVARLGGTRHEVLPDRIETGTYAMAVAMTGGDVILKDTRAELLHAALDVLATTGAEVTQVEGGILQAIGWTLKERVRFDATRITSRDWTSYPVLTFAEVPELDVRVVDRPGTPPLGAGECSLGPTAAAIANAIADAAGVRLRDLPLTPDVVRAAVARRAERT